MMRSANEPSHELEVYLNTSVELCEFLSACAAGKSFLETEKF
jgi:hypothetical protein